MQGDCWAGSSRTLILPEVDKCNFSISLPTLLCPILPYLSACPPPWCSIPNGHCWVQNFGIFLCNALPFSAGFGNSGCAAVLKELLVIAPSQLPQSTAKKFAMKVPQCACQSMGPLSTCPVQEPLWTGAAIGFPALVRICSTSYKLANMPLMLWQIVP